MHRRTALSVLAGSMGLSSGCSTLRGDTLSGRSNETRSDGITLESIRVENRSATATDFDTTTVVAGGTNQFHSELSVDAGESVSPTAAWENPAESFVVVGDATRYGDEVVSANHEENRTDAPLVVEFVIDGQGDLAGNLTTAQSD